MIQRVQSAENGSEKRFKIITTLRFDGPFGTDKKKHKGRNEARRQRVVNLPRLILPGKCDVRSRVLALVSGGVLVDKCTRTGVDFDGQLESRSDVDHAANADPQTNTEAEYDRTEASLRF